MGRQEIPASPKKEEQMDNVIQTMRQMVIEFEIVMQGCSKVITTEPLDNNQLDYLKVGIQNCLSDACGFVNFTNSEGNKMYLSSNILKNCLITFQEVVLTDSYKPTVVPLKG